MQLIGPLASGVVGAGNGYAMVRRRGTSTLATVYSDFYGTTMTHPASGLVLDANGGKIVYVNELVDVEVQDSTGTVLREFVAGEASPNVEVISDSFTGTDYDTAASAAGNPTTLQAVLDAWMDSAGAIDWKVDIGGTATTLEVALASVAGLYINVKDPTYGAVGDGATDDTTAIQAALTAAGSTRATVVFPAGTYKVTSKLTVPLGVSLLGVGASASRISMAHATNDTLEFQGNNSGNVRGFQSMRGLHIAPSQSNSGDLVALPSGYTYVVSLSMESCILGDPNETYHTGLLADVDSANTLVVSTTYGHARGAAGIDASASGPPNLWIKNSVIYATGAFAGSLIKLRLGAISDSAIVINNLATTNIGVECIGNGAGTGPRVSIVGNAFYGGTGGTDTAITVTNGNETNTRVTEYGNQFDTYWTTIYSGFTIGTNNPVLTAGSRDTRVYAVTDNTANVDILAEQYGVVILTHTSNATQNVNASAGPPGARLLFIFVNSSGGNHTNTVTFNTGFYSTAGSFSGVANGNLTVYQFIAVRNGAGSAVWVQTAAILNNI